MVRASLLLLEVWLIAPYVAGDRPDLPELKLDPAKVSLELCGARSSPCEVQSSDI